MINDLPPFTELNPPQKIWSSTFFDELNLKITDVTSGRVHVKKCVVCETDRPIAAYGF